MAAGQAVAPAPPPGFQLDATPPATPPPPPGFNLDSQGGATPAVAKPAIPGRPSAGFDVPGFEPQPQYKDPMEGQSFFQKYIGGPVEAATSVATGMVAAPIGAMANLGSRFSGATNFEANRRGETVQRALTYEPKMPAGQERLSQFQHVFDESKLAGLGPTEGMALGRAARLTPSPEVVPTPPRGTATGGTARATLEAAQAKGFKVTPSAVSESKIPKLVEGIPSKAKMTAKLSTHNQEMRNRAVSEDLGLPPDTSLSTEVLDSVREHAYDAYENLAKAQYGQQGVVATPKFQQAVQQAFKEATSLEQEFPGSVKSQDIRGVLQDFGKGQFTPDGALGIVKRLRNQSSANLRKADNYEAGELGRFQYKVAQAMEDLIGENLQRIGKPELMDQFRQARSMIAKSYDVEYAMNKATGDVSGARLANISDRRPLSGGLKTAADFAKAFPGDNRDVARIGGKPTFNAWDFLVAGGTAMAGHPGLAVGELASRGLIPELSMANWYQRRFARYPTPKPGLGLRMTGEPSGLPYEAGAGAPQALGVPPPPAAAPGQPDRRGMLERGLDFLVPSAQAADAMGPREQEAYKRATGSSIDAREAPPVTVERTSQGVVPPPPNVQGLAALLLKSGRAKTMQEALKQAQEMTAGRR